MLESVTTYRHLPTIAVAVVAAACLGIFSGNSTMLDTMILSGIFSVMAVSLGMCFGQGGIMSLGQAAFAAIGAYASAILTSRHDLPVLVGLVVAVLLPAIIAYPFALLTVRLSHLALALATLFLGEIVVVLLSEGGELTGGHIGLGGIPTLTSDPVIYAAITWVFVVVAVMMYANLVRTAAGRALNTLRNDRMRSQADGDRGPRRIAMVFALAAGMCGAAGWLYAHYLTYLAPESLSPMVSITLLLMVIVGGFRYVLGPVVGAVALTLMVDHLPDEIEGVLFGATLIVVLLIAPHGLLGFAQTLVQRFKHRNSAAQVDTHDQAEVSVR